jgi:hypothetical protein
MGHRDMQFYRSQGAGEGGVHIPYYHGHVRALPQEDPLELHHHLSGLFRMGARANAKMDMGVRELEILKKRVGHINVIVLSGMHQKELYPVPS